jgi:thymidylate synthase
MRVYLNCLQAIVDIGRELKKCANTVHTQTMQNKKIKGDNDYKTKEIQAFAFTVINCKDKDLMPLVTLDWCKKEFEERISRKNINPGEAYKIREEVWNEFLVNDKFEYTYSERMYWQIDAIIKELKKNPETRQAIIQIHNRIIDQERMGKQRVPCSMTYSFMLRNKKLDLIYYMRSTDFSTHFQNDLWLASELQQYIAKKIKKSVGKFIFFANSLHIYKKDWDVLKNY